MGEPWKRPHIDQFIFDNARGLVFMNTDTTYIINDTAPNNHCKGQIRVWGNTHTGHSVVVVCNTFFPYFWAHFPQKLRDKPQKLHSIIKKLETYAGDIVRIETGVRTTIMNFQWDSPALADIPSYRVPEKAAQQTHESKWTMHRIYMSSPQHIAKARDALEDGVLQVTGGIPIRTYEANVPFAMRFMCDIGLAGCQWASIPAAMLVPIRDARFGAQLAFELVDYTQITPIPTNVIAHLNGWRWLSYDIETCRHPDEPGFCDATCDPVSQICCVLYEAGRDVIHRQAFCLVPPGQGCASIINADAILTFEDERELLRAFLYDYMRQTDCDMITGYNIMNFDNRYLFDRAKALGVLQDINQFSRDAQIPVRLKEKMFRSKARGTSKTLEMHCEGRACYDALIYFRNLDGKKLRSYTLNNVAKVHMKREKADVTYDQIWGLQHGSDADRARLLHYCMVDAELVIDLLKVRMAIVNAAEQSRVTGVMPKMLIQNGEQIKTFSKLIRVSNAQDYVVPSRTENENDEDTKGGNVFEPDRRYFGPDEPIATLDFKSLYPSIMEAYNISYDTFILIAEAAVRCLPKEYFYVPPIPGCTYAFVKPNIRQGILGEIVHALLAARSRAKKDMNAEQDPEKKAVLDARQLALKLACNAVYGFTKANKVCKKELMEAITAYGRDMIFLTKDLVETYYTPENTRKQYANASAALQMVYNSQHVAVADRQQFRGASRMILSGFREDIVDEPARVAYGDTDSVMVRFGRISIDRCFYLGHRAAAYCTIYFVHPNELEMEAVKCPASFVEKKKYFAWEYTYPGDKGSLLIKGETGKRRDNFPLVAELQADCANQIFHKNDIQGAIQLVHDTCHKLLMGRVDMSKLIMSQAFSKTETEYEKGGTRPAHIELMKRIRARAMETGEHVPASGERIPYIIKPGSSKRMKKFERSEDPLFAMKNGIYPDPQWYIDNLKRPILRLFATILSNGKERLTKGITDNAMQRLVAYKILFEGPHMMQRRQIVTPKHALSAFTVKVDRCLRCRNVIRPNSSPSKVVCRTCMPHLPAIHQETLLAHQRTERAWNDAWTRCQRCQGSVHNVVVCGNRECDNFYRRHALTIDIEDLCNKLEKF